MSTGKLIRTEAKHSDLVSVLSHLNREPKKIHGLEEGNNVIDFGIQYFHYPVKKWLSLLPEISKSKSFSFHPRNDSCI